MQEWVNSIFLWISPQRIQGRLQRKVANSVLKYFLLSHKIIGIEGVHRLLGSTLCSGQASKLKSTKVKLLLGGDSQLWTRVCLPLTELLHVLSSKMIKNELWPSLWYYSVISFQYEERGSIFPLNCLFFLNKCIQFFLSILTECNF